MSIFLISRLYFNHTYSFNDSTFSTPNPRSFSIGSTTDSYSTGRELYTWSMKLLSVISLLNGSSFILALNPSRYVIKVSGSSLISVYSRDIYSLWSASNSVPVLGSYLCLSLFQTSLAFSLVSVLVFSFLVSISNS